MRHHYPVCKLGIDNIAGDVCCSLFFFFLKCLKRTNILYSGPVHGQPGGFVGCSVATCARRNTALFFTIDWFNVGVFSPGQIPPSLKREL